MKFSKEIFMKILNKDSLGDFWNHTFKWLKKNTHSICFSGEWQRFRGRIILWDFGDVKLKQEWRPIS